MSRQSEVPVEQLNLEEALADRAKLVDECQDIQTQLSNRNRTDRDGNRVEGDDYWRWRSNALYAMRCRQKRMSALKEHIRKLRTQQNVESAGVRDLTDKGLLSEAYKLLRKIVADIDGDVDPEEQALMDVIRDRIEGRV